MPGGQGVDHRLDVRRGRLDQAELGPVGGLAHELGVDGDEGLAGQPLAEGRELGGGGDRRHRLAIARREAASLQGRSAAMSARMPVRSAPKHVHDQATERPDLRRRRRRHRRRRRAGRAIKPLAGATRRPGRGREAGRVRRPVRPQGGRLRRPAAGLHHRRRRHQAEGRHRDRAARHRRRSIWWPCASTTSWPRAPSRCCSSTISPPASSTSKAAGERGRRHRRGLPPGRRRAGRRRDGGDAGHVRRRRLRPGRASASAPSSADGVLPRLGDQRARRRDDRPRLLRRRTPTAIP